MGGEAWRREDDRMGSGAGVGEPGWGGWGVCLSVGPTRPFVCLSLGQPRLGPHALVRAVSPVRAALHHDPALTPNPTNRLRFFRRPLTPSPTSQADASRAPVQAKFAPSRRSRARLAVCPGTSAVAQTPPAPLPPRGLRAQHSEPARLRATPSSRAAALSALASIASPAAGSGSGARLAAPGDAGSWRPWMREAVDPAGDAGSTASRSIMQRAATAAPGLTATAGAWANSPQLGLRGMGLL